MRKFNVLRQSVPTLLQVVARVAIFQVVALTTPSALAASSAKVTNLQYDARAELI